MTADIQSPVQLQPPGAGLPFLELHLSRLGFGLLRRSLSRKRADAWFRDMDGVTLEIPAIETEALRNILRVDLTTTPKKTPPPK